MDAIQAYLENLKQGGKQNYLNLTIIPLLSPNGGEPDYLTLEEGLRQGVVTITEVSQARTFLGCSNGIIGNQRRTKP